MNKIKLIVCALSFAFYLQSYSQAPVNTPARLTMDKVLFEGAEYNLIKPLLGNWNVEMKTWTDSSDKPVVVANYVAERTMQGHFLEEVMHPASATDKPFKRIVYLNYNYATSTWEYIVLDTRYPVMMFETSMGNEQDNKKLNLYLPSFVMPPGWIDKNGGQFTKEHRIVDFINNDKTLMQQYWTPPGGKEFLAVQYTYTRAK